jgi:hypothetical protein
MLENVVFGTCMIFMFVAALFGFRMTRRFALVVLRTESLDNPLYVRWGSPKKGGFFKIRQQDLGKLNWAMFAVFINHPSKLTQQPELQQEFASVRKLLIWWNIIIFIYIPIWSYLLVLFEI